MSQGLEERGEELQAVWLYERIAAREKDAVARTLFTELAAAARRQAQIWEQRVREQTGAEPPAWRPSARARLVAALVHALGVRPIRPVLAAMKVRGLSLYRSRRPAPPHPMPTSRADLGHRHGAIAGAGNLRAAVFGVNDGLVSNASLILGFSGAGAEPRVVLLSGVAGLLAGACSMAAGEYISVRSQRELFEHQLRLERAELELYPLEETEELALIYNARGLTLERAREVARAVMQDREGALDTLAREELGLDPDDLGSPLGAALASFLAFGVGASVPLAPFLWDGGVDRIVPAGIASGVALFAIGCALSLFTGRAALWSGLRMVLIGAAAGAATFAIGALFGVAV